MFLNIFVIVLYSADDIFVQFDVFWARQSSNSVEKWLVWNLETRNKHEFLPCADVREHGEKTKTNSRREQRCG